MPKSRSIDFYVNSTHYARSIQQHIFYFARILGNTLRLTSHRNFLSPACTADDVWSVERVKSSQ